MFLPDKMTNLAIHLAEGGKTSEALSLVRKLLDRFTQEMERSDAYATWRSDRLVERLTPALGAYGGLPALTLLCEALLRSLGEAAHVDDAEYDDSYIWRSAIEDHQQNTPEGFRGLRDLLISANRDVAERQIRDGKATPSQVVDMLEQFHAPIFTRLAMHLLRLFPDQARDIVANYLTTHEYFDRLCYRYEYTLLSSVCFRFLTSEEQQTILGWIAATPDWGLADPREDQMAREGAERTAEDKVDYWRLQRLTPFAHDLPPIWKARYDKLVQRYGVPEHPEFVMYFTAGWVDNTAGAVTVEQLRAMKMSQLIRYLEAWVPSESWRGQSREGVGQLLAEMIRTDPEPFARDAKRFAGLHPVYLAAVFQGFERALSQQAAFPWGAILRLARDTLRSAESAGPNERGTTVERAPTDAGNDANARTNESGVATTPDGAVTRETPSFAWVRNTIAQLLERALGSQPVPIGPELRGLIWDILRPLATDPDPTPANEQRLGGDNMDPVTLAINSVRGLALHAVILYAVWSSTLATATSDGAGKVTVARSDLATAAPGMLEVLDEHLDVAKDSSRAIRSIYGQRFPVLAALDPTWTAARVAAIFPPSEDQRHLWQAAWDAYVLYNLPTQRAWTLLRDEYGRALVRQDTSENGRRHAAEAEVRTVEHLIELAMAGEIPIGEPGTVLERAYGRAGDQILGEVTSHIGLRAVNTKGALPDMIRQGLQALWQWRMATTLETSAAEHQQELAAFGWWYGSGQFDADWALAQLGKVLALTSGRIQGAHLVFERLAETPAQALGEALGRLRQLVNGVRFEEYSGVWEAQIGNVLAAVRERGDSDSRTQAVQLINQLVARRYVSYRMYLPSLSPSQQPEVTE